MKAVPCVWTLCGKMWKSWKRDLNAVTCMLSMKLHAGEVGIPSRPCFQLYPVILILYLRLVARPLSNSFPMKLHKDWVLKARCCLFTLRSFKMCVKCGFWRKGFCFCGIVFIPGAQSQFFLILTWQCMIRYWIIFWLLNSNSKRHV